VLPQTAPVRDEADPVLITLGQSLHGPHAQPIAELGRHHADARLLDDFPDPIDIFFFVLGHWK
jgi:hypothetical protein